MAKLYVNHCGFSVLPLWYRQKRRLFQGTTFQTRPPDMQHLEHWFLRSDRNLAIVPGEISDNLVILDFDVWEMWQVFHALTGWSGPVVRTSRGVHVYVRLREVPEKNGEGFFQGAHFGQVIVHGAITAPPSIHPSGHVYAWHGSPQHVPYLCVLNDLEIERRDTVTPVVTKPLPTGKKSLPIARAITNQEAYISAAIRAECEKIVNAPRPTKETPGERNIQLYKSALKLSRYIGIITPDALAASLESAARQAGLGRAEIMGTIRSGFVRGQKNFS